MITLTLDRALAPDGAQLVHRFDDAVTRIVIGRGSASDVQLKPDLTKLGRAHFELRRAASGVELVVDREHPVYVDGQRVIERMALPLRQEVRLIDPFSGPAITIICAKTGDGPVTEKDALVDSGTQQGVLGTLKTQARNLAIAASVAALAFGGYLYWDKQQQAAQEQALLSGMQSLADRMAEAEAHSVNWAEVQKLIKPSVYQVTFADGTGGAPKHQGTAWVYAPGKLATNAHVARIFNDPKWMHGRILLVPADPSLPTLAVRKAELHPAYAAYRLALAETKQVGKVLPLADLGSYDVAFLSVAEGAMLGPPLTLASSNAALKPGEPVAYLGYPERCARHPNQLHVKAGIISGTSDFLGTQASQDLIYHTAPGAHGASGSPLFNSRGEVIAVFSGGEMSNPVAVVNKDVAIEASKDCVLSGASTLYAQNISLLRELETGEAASKQQERQAQWRSSALYKLNQNRVWAAVTAISDEPETRDYQHITQHLKLSRPGESRSTMGSAVQRFADMAPGEYAAFARATPGTQIALQTLIGGTAINVPVQIEGKPTVVFSLKEASDVVVTMAGPDALDVTLTVVRLDEEEEPLKP